jgi:hypothetical protein
LFIAAGGETSYWILAIYDDRFAVQLTATPERPAFSFHRLSNVPTAFGLWMGPVELHLGAEFEGSGRRRSGLVVRKGFRLYLKANQPCGTAARLLILPYDLGDCSRWSIFYSDWRLVAETAAEDVCLFRSPRWPPRMRPYTDKEQVRPALTLVRTDRESYRDGVDRT